jgi:hypothetical protein
MTKHGVLTNEGVLTIQGNQWQVLSVGPSDLDLVPWIESATDLMKIGLELGLTHLWVHAETGIDPAAPVEVKQGVFECDDYQGWHLLGHTEGKHIKSIYGWPAPHGTALSVIFPHRSRWGKSNRLDVPGWGALADPKQLLVTIAYLERKLGVPVGGSPGSTGWALHTKIHPEWSKESPAMKTLGQCFRESAGPDFTTQRPYDSTEGVYLHKVDKNSAHLQAAKFDSYYGVGDPVHSTDGRAFDGKSPGAWYCTVDPIKDEFPGYPSGTYWIATPIVRMMQKDETYSVEIHEGWYWQYRDKKDGRVSHAHQVMAKWAQEVWDDRQFFATTEDKAFRRRDCCAFAASAMKQIAVGTVGLSGFKRFGEEESTDKRRPDIRAQTVSRSYELMYYNTLGFANQTGLVPVLTYADALYYVTDSPDIPFPDIFLKRQKELGGYKYEGRITITAEVAACLNDERLNVSKKLELLNKIGWTR